VNPGPARSHSTWLLGDDGGLYRIGQPGERRPRDAGVGEPETLPRFFLGDDGTLYERT
jgi:hypothetical protein